MDTEVPLGSFARLIRRAGQEADELFARSAGIRGVTARQLAVLATVAELDHPSQAILCETTGIDRSTMADLVRRLAGRGWLSRYKTPNDLRAYAVEITPEGKTILHRVLPTAAKVDAALVADLTAKETSDFQALLRCIVDGAKP